MKKKLQQVCSGVLTLSMGWLAACAPQPGQLAALAPQALSPPAQVSATMLRHPRHQPHRLHLQGQLSRRSSSPQPDYFAELEAEYGAFSTLALTASYLERKVRTLIANNDGEGMRREIEFARYKHPQLLIDIMHAAPELYTAAAAMPEVVAFRAVSAPFDAYMLLLFAPAAEPAEFQLNSLPGYPYSGNVAMDGDGHFTVVWSTYDSLNWSEANTVIYARRYTNQGIPQGPEFQVNSVAGFRQSRPAIAMNTAGEFIVAWDSHGQDGDRWGIFARRFNSQAEPLDEEFQVNTHTEASQISPAVAMDAEANFVITWADNFQDGDSYGVYARRYQSNGQPQGDEFQVNTLTTGRQLQPDVAMDADGHFVIVWGSRQHAEQEYTLYAQRYHQNGQAEGEEFIVAAASPGLSQAYPAVVKDPAGDFILSWNQYNLIDGKSHIYARRYQSNGQAQEAAFQVSVSEPYRHMIPAVSMDTTGDFVIAWSRYNLDWDDSDVFARRYDHNGIPKETEFRLNHNTEHFDNNPSVAIDLHGNFVVVWTRYQEDWYGETDLYARRYNAAGLPQ